jgi:hypothetical protein
LNVFDFMVSRHRDGSDAFLDGFAGALLADCYSDYQGIELRTSGMIRRAACSAHARRKVFDARDAYRRQLAPPCNPRAIDRWVLGRPARPQCNFANHRGENTQLSTRPYRR